MVNNVTFDPATTGGAEMGVKWKLEEGRVEEWTLLAHPPACTVRADDKDQVRGLKVQTSPTVF
jgi:hypothetical protein